MHGSNPAPHKLGIMLRLETCCEKKEMKTTERPDKPARRSRIRRFMEPCASACVSFAFPDQFLLLFLEKTMLHHVFFVFDVNESVRLCLKRASAVMRSCIRVPRTFERKETYM